jgi:hypothetical protein
MKEEVQYLNLIEDNSMMEMEIMSCGGLWNGG